MKSRARNSLAKLWEIHELLLRILGEERVLAGSIRSSAVGWNRVGLTVLRSDQKDGVRVGAILYIRSEWLQARRIHIMVVETILSNIS